MSTIPEEKLELPPLIDGEPAPVVTIIRGFFEAYVRTLDRAAEEAAKSATTRRIKRKKK